MTLTNGWISVDERVPGDGERKAVLHHSHVFNVAYWGKRKQSESLADAQPEEIQGE